MTQQAYLTTAHEIARALTTAICEAEALVPEGIRARQWMFAKHQPSQSQGWEATHDWLYGTEEADEETLRVLLHLKLLTAAYANLITVLEPVPAGEPDVSLPKVRRRYA